MTADEIVRQLAAKEPRDRGDANTLPRCTLCGASVSMVDWEARAEKYNWNALDAALANEPPLPISHKPNCPYALALSYVAANPEAK